MGSEMCIRDRLRVPIENNQIYGGVDKDYADRINHEILRLTQWGRGDSDELIAALKDSIKSVQTSNVVLDSLGVVQVLERSDDTATVS